MPRRPRVVIPGVPHHITQRGNHRENTFFSERDRIRYIEILREHSRRQGVRIVGWCLMTNHVHLIAIPADPESLALALGQAHSQYSLEQNRQQSRTGHLWQGRFFSCPLESDRLKSAIRYVELNPVRAGITVAAWDWRWSSARAHTSQQAQDSLLDWPWQEWMEEARLGVWSFTDWKTILLSAGPADELDRLRRATRLGEPLGSEEFVNDLEMKAGRRLRVLRQGRPPVNRMATAVAVQKSLFEE